MWYCSDAARSEVICPGPSFELERTMPSGVDVHRRGCGTHPEGTLKAGISERNANSRLVGDKK